MTPAVKVVLLSIAASYCLCEDDVVGLLQTKLDVKLDAKNDRKSMKKDIMLLNSSGLEVDMLSKSNHNTTYQKEASVQPDCFINTGGTCRIRRCSVSRGPTTCSFGECLCQTGYCSGANGRCYKGHYKLILDDFTIRNYRWDNEYMYASIFAVGRDYSLRVSKNNRSEKSRFRLFEMPDGAVVMTNKAYPRYAVTIAKHISHDTTTDHNGYQSVTRSVTWNAKLSYIGGTSLLNFGFEPSADREALELYAPPLEESRWILTGGAVMIGSWKYPRRYLYVPGLSWQVEVYGGDPGDGGLWVFDPPLPSHFPLRRFEGRICSFDCSGPVSFASQVLKYGGIVVGILLVMGVVVGVPFVMMSGRT